jgi:hypothetical protein
LPSAELVIVVMDELMDKLMDKRHKVRVFSSLLKPRVSP